MKTSLFASFFPWHVLCVGGNYYPQEELDGSHVLVARNVRFRSRRDGVVLPVLNRLRKDLRRTR